MTPTFSPDLATQALKFAATRHATQRIPGSDLPYILHPVMVCMELIAALEDECRSRLRRDNQARGTSMPQCHDLTYINNDLAIQCALLHDVLEDTPTTYHEIEQQFGKPVAEGVSALSKDQSLPKELQMEDSLTRIRLQPKEVWMVKLADRITNLAPPPAFWTQEKCRHYLQDAFIIHEALKDASTTLGNRLLVKIEEYKRYC